MSKSQSALASALPCEACKQPVIQKQTADGALVVLDAATKRLHLCVKRKAIEAAKAKQMPPRPKPTAPTKPLPPAKRPPMARAQERTQKPPRRPPPPGKPVKPPKPPRPPRPPRPTTLRTPQQVEEILKGPVMRWRTAADSPTSFCAVCAAPVLVGFSHVRWDVMMLDAVGHRPHDCEQSRQVAAALRAQAARPVDIPELPAEAKPARRVVREAPTTAPVTPTVAAPPKPRRRPGGNAPRNAPANACDTCGKLKTMANGEWVCLHCGA
jgi:hypothetical protein